MLGDGKGTSAWYDSWRNIGLLSAFLSSRDIHLAGFNLQSRVADITENSLWKWPTFLVGKYNQLAGIECPILCQEKSDTFA